ncbi:MAG: hypothetical protein KUG77_17405 [Nannocystaceae bacterium]|nr:hypothetical protein [Nannocystaceae bacterium]
MYKRQVQDPTLALRQLELQVALAHLDGATEGELRRLVGARLALDDQAAAIGLGDVDISVGDCLRWRCDTQSIWQAIQYGISTGAVLAEIYRDGFVEGYRDALGCGPVHLAAE